MNRATTSSRKLHIDFCGNYAANLYTGCGVSSFFQPFVIWEAGVVDAATPISEGRIDNYHLEISPKTQGLLAERVIEQDRAMRNQAGVSPPTGPGGRRYPFGV